MVPTKLWMYYLIFYKLSERTLFDLFFGNIHLGVRQSSRLQKFTKQVKFPINVWLNFY